MCRLAFSRKFVRMLGGLLVFSGCALQFFQRVPTLTAVCVSASLQKMCSVFVWIFVVFPLDFVVFCSVSSDIRS